MANYQINLEDFLPQCDPNSYWIITWIGGFKYMYGKYHVNIEIVNSTTPYFRISHFNKSLNISITIPVYYLMDICFGSVFSFDGKLIPQDYSTYDSFNWKYLNGTQSVYNGNDKLATLSLLETFNYPISEKSKNSNFRYYVLRIPYKTRNHTNTNDRFFLVVIPEIVLIKFFFFEKNSVDGINSMINGSFIEDVIKEAYIVKENEIQTGYVKYDNNVLPPSSIRKLAQFFFLRNNNGIRSIKELNSSQFVNNDIAKTFPFDSNIDVLLYGRYLGKKKSSPDGVLNIFLALGVKFLDILDHSIFTVDRYKLVKSIERNSTKSRDDAKTEMYTSYLNKNKNESRNQSIKANKRINSVRKSKIIDDDNISDFGINLPVSFEKRTEQDQKWEMENQRFVIHDTDSITGSNETSKDSKSFGSNYTRRNDNSKIIDRSFDFFNKVTTILEKKGILGEYLRVNNNDAFYNQLVFYRKSFWYLIFEMKYKDKYFYLIKFDPSLTSYIPFLNESNLNQIELDDLKLILKKFANSSFNMRKIKGKKLLNKVNTEQHNFNHRFKKNTEADKHFASKIKTMIILKYKHLI